MSCGCYMCLRENHDPIEILEGIKVPYPDTFMVVCAICGNKRCPHGTDHQYPCTNSNEPGQPGSRYL